MLTDTHCHLFYEELEVDLPEILKRANESGVKRLICIGTNIKDSKKCLKICDDYNNIFASVGVHPHEAGGVSDNFEEHIYQMTQNKAVVAIGEMGLDYYRNISSPDIQKDIFKKQLTIAEELSLPVVIHNRDSDTDLLSILANFKAVIGVAHCFSGQLETAKRFLELGYYISFSGNLTFKNSHLPEIAQSIPLNRTLIETDSPFLSPAPFRGRINEPGRVGLVARKLSEIHNISYEKIAEITSFNASRLFKIC